MMDADFIIPRLNPIQSSTKGRLLGSSTVGDGGSLGLAYAEFFRLLWQMPEKDRAEVVRLATKQGTDAYAKGFRAGKAEFVEPRLETLVSTWGRLARQAVGPDKVEYAMELQKFSRKMEAFHTGRLDELNIEIRDQTRRITIYDDIRDLLQNPFELGKPNGFVSAHLVASFRAGNVERTFNDDTPKEVTALDGFTQSFLVEHDWAAAFAKAIDFDGEWRIPYDGCFFELKISGRRIVAAVVSLEDHLNCLLFVQTKGGWALLGSYIMKNDVWKSDAAGSEPVEFMGFVGIQIKALCIALDAEIAVSTVVRTEHVGRESKEREALPFFECRTISLASRTRVTSLSRDDTEVKYHHRLHFVRGHWRHYESHKTWIKWHLRGDPDLGFIDKSYRL